MLSGGLFDTWTMCHRISISPFLQYCRGNVDITTNNQEQRRTCRHTNLREWRRVVTRRLPGTLSDRNSEPSSLHHWSRFRPGLPVENRFG